MWAALFYVNYVSMKLKLGHEYSQFWMLVLACTSKYFQIHKEICGFWMLLYLDFSVFPNSWKEWKIVFF